MEEAEAAEVAAEADLAVAATAAASEEAVAAVDLAAVPAEDSGDIDRLPPEALALAAPFSAALGTIDPAITATTAAVDAWAVWCP